MLGRIGGNIPGSKQFILLHWTFERSPPHEKKARLHRQLCSYARRQRSGQQAIYSAAHEQAWQFVLWEPKSASYRRICLSVSRMRSSWSSVLNSTKTTIFIHNIGNGHMISCITIVEFSILMQKIQKLKVMSSKDRPSFSYLQHSDGFLGKSYVDFPKYFFTKRGTEFHLSVQLNHVCALINSHLSIFFYRCPYDFLGVCSPRYPYCEAHYHRKRLSCFSKS